MESAQKNKSWIFYFTLFNFILWVIFGLGYFCVSGIEKGALPFVFAVSFLPGHMFVFALLLALPALALCFVKRKAALAVALGLSSFITLFFITDLIVFSQYRFHINYSMLQLFFGPAGREIFPFPPSMYILAALGALAITGAECGLLRLSLKLKKIKTKFVVLPLCILFAAWVCYNALFAYGRFTGTGAVTAQAELLPLAFPVSMNGFFRKMGITPGQNYEVKKSGHFNYPLNPMECVPQEEPLNIILILADGWRFDMFSTEITPNLYKFSKKSQLFTRHISGGNATQAGMFSLFYSIPANYWDAAMSSKKGPAVITELKRQNYQIGIYSSGRLNSPELNKTVFIDIPNLRLQSKGADTVERDLDAQKDFEDFVSSRDKSRPFFGFLFYDVTHGYSFPPGNAPFTPYLKEINYLLLNNDTDNTEFMNSYKNSSHFIDVMFADLMKFLKAQDLDKNTVIIITADHGQEINDSRQNYWGHNSNFSRYQTQVPLIVYWPGMDAAVYNYPTSGMDIMPTLLKRVLGCGNDVKDYSSGADLFYGGKHHIYINSYSKKVVVDGNDMTVISGYGGLENRTFDMWSKNSPGASPAEISGALEEFSRFYK